MSNRSRKEHLDEKERQLLESLGISASDIADAVETPPPAPSKDELVTHLRGLLSPNSLDQASRGLQSMWIREHIAPHLEEVVFSDEFLNAPTNPKAHSTVVKMLCDLSPQFVVGNIDRLMSLDNRKDVDECLTTAFSVSFDGDKRLRICNTQCELGEIVSLT